MTQMSKEERKRFLDGALNDAQSRASTGNLEGTFFNLKEAQRLSEGTEKEVLLPKMGSILKEAYTVAAKNERKAASDERKAASEGSLEPNTAHIHDANTSKYDFNVKVLNGLIQYSILSEDED